MGEVSPPEEEAQADHHGPGLGPGLGPGPGVKARRLQNLFEERGREEAGQGEGCGNGRGDECYQETKGLVSTEFCREDRSCFRVSRWW